MSNDYGSFSTLTVVDFICLPQLASILLSTEAQSLLLSTQNNGQYLPVWFPCHPSPFLMSSMDMGSSCIKPQLP